MKISHEEIRDIAHEARLDPKEEEIEKLSLQLGRVLSYLEKINEIRTDDVSPITHVLELQNVMREDEIKPSLNLEEVLSNAPSVEGDYFRAPKVIE